MEKLYEEIAKNIRFYRKQKGLTQKELASTLGITPSAICNYEAGYTIDIDTLCSICDILGRDLTDMSLSFSKSNTSKYSNKEERIISAYREHPEFQPAVDKLLDLTDDTVPEQS